jgi:hypothetical protein
MKKIDVKRSADWKNPPQCRHEFVVSFQTLQDSRMPVLARAGISGMGSSAVVWHCGWHGFEAFDPGQTGRIGMSDEVFGAIS